MRTINARRSNVALRCWMMFALGISFITPFTPAARAQVQQDSVRAEGSRPLAAAVLQFERHCHCVVTYEDPRWTHEQVHDLPGYRSGPTTPKVPIGRPFTFALPEDLGRREPDQVEVSLRQLLTAFERENGGGAFKVMSSPGRLHVIPAHDALFDAPVTFSGGERTLFEALKALTESLSVSSHRDVRLASVPVNLTMNTTVTLGAINQRAGDVMAGMFAATTQKLSWRLLYDFDDDAWFLNVHIVR